MLNPVAVTAGNLRRGLIERISARMRTGLARPMWRRRLASFGADSAIEPPGWVFGGKGISIATRVWVARGARLEAFRLESGTVRLSIDEGCMIGPHVHIGAAESVKIGRSVLMASHVYITDHDHDYSDPFDPVMTNNRLLVASVEIGDHVWLGERVCVLKGVRVGERSVIGAGSVVVKDVPPLSIAVGVPARVVRRFDCEAKQWIRV